MKIVQTRDGSFTCFSEEYKELYHARNGALEEAFKKYIEPCEIKDNYKILDIGFGLGYNSAAALHRFKNLKIIALEKDRKILNQILKMKVPSYFEEVFEIIKKVSQTLEYKNHSEIKIILGDASKTITTINEKFDAVFLDPFNFKTNKELWSLSFLKEIKKRMKPDAILSTYSSAAPVRKTLLEAGFNIKNGPKVGSYCTLVSINLPFKLLEKDQKIVNVFGEVIL